MIYFYSDNPNGFVTGDRFSIDLPCPTIMAAGMAGDSLGHWHFADDGLPDRKIMRQDKKPAYRVPTMAQVAKVKPCGLTVASTFAGTGGSSLGYRMAGFNVVWANEFVPAAADSYAANMAERTVLDRRDVRVVRGDDVLTTLGIERGDLDVLDGSPPCQAFSTAGRREKNWGKERKYEHGATQRNEELFTDFIRLRDELQPRAFVAENVSGLLKGVAKGFFLEILEELSRGYRVECRLLDAQWLGVPQARQRCFFVGVREDLGLEPEFPKPLPYRYSVRDALPWLGKIELDTRGQFKSKHGLGRPVPTITGSSLHHLKVAEGGMSPCLENQYEWLNPGQASDKYFQMVRADPAKPSPTITAHAGPATVVHPFEKRKFTIAELRLLCSFPADFVLTGSYAQQWERLGNSVPPLMMRAVAEAVRDVLLRASARTSARAVRSPGRSTSAKRPTGAAQRKGRRASKTAASAR